MKYFLGAALLTALSLTPSQAQTEVALPELPAPAGTEAPMPVLPAPTSTYEVPQTPSAPLVTPPKQMSEEEIARLKQDENWLVEGMKKKQEEDAAAAAAQLKKSSEMDSKKDMEPKDSNIRPGELSVFKPVLANSSLSSLNQDNSNSSKKKSSLQNDLELNNKPSSSNPLSNSTSGPVQPILGPSRQPTNANVASLNPGVGVAPLPATGIKKISSNTNFVPEGYADSWKQQSPYQSLTPQGPKPIPAPVNPPAPRPTFRDLANTIPDPTQVR